MIGDRRPPSPLEKIQPDGWLAEYTEDLLNLLNVLGRLIALEPRQADLLERIVAGPLVALAARANRSRGQRTTSRRNRRRVLWQTQLDRFTPPDEDEAARDDTPTGPVRRKPSPSFRASKPAAVYRADPDKVRAELLRVLAKVRAAQSFPWDARRTLYWRTVFPQMTNWLPDEEAAQLRFAFETEIRRLEAA